MVFEVLPLSFHYYLMPWTFVNFFCSALYDPVLHNKSGNSLSLVILKDFIQVWFCYLAEKLSPQRYDMYMYIFCNICQVGSSLLTASQCQWMVLLSGQCKMIYSILCWIWVLKLFLYQWKKILFVYSIASLMINNSSIHIHFCTISWDNMVTSI